MKTFLVALTLISVSYCYAGEEPVPTPAKTEDTVSVLQKNCDQSCSSCSIRRRGLFGRRGFVINRVTVDGNCVSSSRQVIDGCCNTVRTTTTIENSDCCGRSRTVLRRRGYGACSSCNTCK